MKQRLQKILFFLLLSSLLSGMSACSANNIPPQASALPTQAVTHSPAAITPIAPVASPTVLAPTETASLPATSPVSALAGTATPDTLPTLSVNFDAPRAYQDMLYQMALGPRTPGSEAHSKEVIWLKQQLEESGWTVEVQETTRMGHPVQNVIAKRGTSGPWTILGAHFDSRMKADQDPNVALRNDPVPAANDGAAGIAVLLELARDLPKDLNQQIWLAFIDAEDQGDIPGWDWLLGSRALAESLQSKPDGVIIIDMIGDANLNIYKEQNSDPGLTQQIWQLAAQLGYEKYFIPQVKYSMLDDHTPFLERGMRAIDIIDFDYPYWHTTQDTADKVSANSLEVVGNTLLHYFMQVVGS